MKKFHVIIVILAVFGIALCGCTSSKKITELEKRVEYLESVIGKDTGKSYSSSTSSDSKETKNAKETETKEAKPSNQSEEDDNRIEYAWLLEGVSNDEIVNYCDLIMSNFPQKGQSYEDYRRSLLKEPLSESTWGDMVYNYVSASNPEYEYVYDREAIRYISISGTQMEMDGSIGYANGTSVYISVQLTVNGYEKASDLYEKLFKLLSPVYEKAEHGNNVYKITDNRESTSWSASGGVFVPSSYSLTVVHFLKMQKMDSIYIITAIKAFVPSTEE